MSRRGFRPLFTPRPRPGDDRPLPSVTPMDPASSLRLRLQIAIREHRFNEALARQLLRTVEEVQEAREIIRAMSFDPRSNARTVFSRILTMRDHEIEVAARAAAANQPTPLENA